MTTKTTRKATGAKTAGSTDTVYAMVTEQILAALDAGTVPWRKPWTGSATGGPRNLMSGKPYRGINVFLLGFAPYASPYWVTFRQANELGGSIRKGEKGSLVVFWKQLKVTEKDEVTGKPTTKTIPMLRYYRVWNLEQTEGVRIPKGRELAVEAPVRDEAERIAAADGIVARFTGDAGPSVAHGGDQAYYSPGADHVQMPALAAFDGAAEYYSTLFHELTHSTGHASRLDRFAKGFNAHSFGSAEYGREELIAEMGAAFLCAEVDILPATIANSAAYIDGWRRTIKEDVRAVVVAAGAAQRAADLVLGRAPYVAAETATEEAAPAGELVAA